MSSMPKIGDSHWRNACYLKVHATWEGVNAPTARDAAYFGPDPGWVIDDYELKVVDRMNDYDYSVSYLPGGLHLIDEVVFEKLVQSALDATVGQGQENYQAAIEEYMAMYKRFRAELATNQNLVRVHAEATPVGWVFDRKGSKVELQVKALVRYVGVPDPLLVAEEMILHCQLPPPAAESLRNAARDLRVEYPSQTLEQAKLALQQEIDLVEGVESVAAGGAGGRYKERPLYRK